MPSSGIELTTIQLVDRRLNLLRYRVRDDGNDYNDYNLLSPANYAVMPEFSMFRPISIYIVIFSM
jgi:hypothetical protein